MKIIDIMSELEDKHFSIWLKTRQEVSNEMSDKQSMFCICGKLATGFHESSCSKFKNKVNIETTKRLSYLIVKPK